MQIDLARRKILVTGVAGFIGAYITKRLLETVFPITIVGLDNMNNYYDVSLKEERLAQLQSYDSFFFHKGNVADKKLIEKVFSDLQPDIVIHMAAQAGVRYSITNPDAYIESNIIGFFRILEACRQYPVKHLIYASSSSVYGLDNRVPYSTGDKVDSPVSLYAATKVSNESMAHAYSKLYNIPTTGLRFFTVYGPCGRPDMAYFSFADTMVNGGTIQLYNYGEMKRDFTYIDDIVTGVIQVVARPPEENANGVRCKVYNLGNNKPVDLGYFVETLEKCLVTEGLIKNPVKKELLPMQPGDVYQTFADISDSQSDFGFKPKMTIEQGLAEFVKWYRGYRYG